MYARPLILTSAQVDNMHHSTIGVKRPRVHNVGCLSQHASVVRQTVGTAENADVNVEHARVVQHSVEADENAAANVQHARIVRPAADVNNIRQQHASVGANAEQRRASDDSRNIIARQCETVDETAQRNALSTPVIKRGDQQEQIQLELAMQTSLMEAEIRFGQNVGSLNVGTVENADAHVEHARVVRSAVDANAHNISQLYVSVGANAEQRRAAANSRQIIARQRETADETAQRRARDAWSTAVTRQLETPAKTAQRQANNALTTAIPRQSAEAFWRQIGEVNMEHVLKGDYRVKTSTILEVLTSTHAHVSLDWEAKSTLARRITDDNTPTRQWKKACDMQSDLYARLLPAHERICNVCQVLQMEKRVAMHIEAGEEYVRFVNIYPSLDWMYCILRILVELTSDYQIGILEYEVQEGPGHK